jgi:hypothetical protein
MICGLNVLIDGFYFRCVDPQLSNLDFVLQLPCGLMKK